ncbi:MAG TPA: 50S ribosomal protein L15 [Polyangia bacterium]|jgi:large subunit ribosomal protein L15
MGTTLHTLKGPKGASRNRIRVGRGHGSGRGETSGKGIKGQKARTGHHGARMGFEGGQMPLQRRLPKRGFHNLFRRDIVVVNVGALAERFPDGTVDPDRLREAGMVPRSAKLVKVLAQGDITHALTIKAHLFSKMAQEKITKAGGQFEVIPERLAAPAKASGAPV